MKTRDSTLFIVPTSGNIVQDGRLIPGGICRVRLETAYRTLRPTDRIAICGGRRQMADSAEAKVAFDWFSRYRRGARNKVVFVFADDVCTARDMEWLAFRAKYAEQEAGIFFSKWTVVSHPWHAKLAVSTLRACYPEKPIDWLDSEERRTFSLISYCLRLLITKLDPKWEKWPSAYFRRLAEKRYFLDRA